MNSCEHCLEVVPDDQLVVVRGLADRPGIAEVCRECLDGVLRSRSLRPPAPTLREELDAIFEGQGVG